MSQRLVAVSMVKNEADIIEANIRHHARLVDHLVVFDHDSTDSTPDILRELVREGLPLTLVRATSAEPAYRQSAVMTRLVRDAFGKQSADYVFPLDADEFVRAPSRAALEEALQRANAPVACLPWVTYVANDADDAHPLRALRWRVQAKRRPMSKIVLSRAVLDRHDWRCGIGNHVSLWSIGSDMHWDAGTAMPGIDLAHLPLRSPAQLIAKALIGWLGFRLGHGRNAGANSHAWHLRALYERIMAGDRIGDSDVREHAIALYALGCSPRRLSPDQYTLVEDQAAAAMPLRFTPTMSVDPTRLLAAWSAALVDRVINRPAGAALPAPGGPTI